MPLHPQNSALDVKQSGSAMFLSMISLVALLSLGGITVLTVQSSMSAGSIARHQKVALYAAESGLTAGMEFLRTSYSPVTKWSTLIKEAGAPVTPECAIVGNHGDDCTPVAVLSEEMKASYQVTIQNNLSDSGYAIGDDNDSRVVLRSTGFGPNGATVTLEVEVASNGAGTAGQRPCPGYAQRGMSEDDSGRNDCLGLVSGNDIQSFNPGAQ